MIQKLQSTFIITIYTEQTETKYNPEDDYQLLSGGGCMMYDIVTQPVLNFSNGNCELLITEGMQLKIIVVTLYRSPVPNSALSKFAKVLDRVQQYLTQREDEENVRIILKGDFNLPLRVVEWFNSEEGVLSNIKPGSTPEKVALSLLLGLTNNFSIEQILTKGTREENT